MNRRAFAKLIAVIATSAATESAALPIVAQRSRRLIKPAALKLGDLVGLIAPSGVMDDATIEKSVNNLESFGFKVKVSDNIRAARGGYAGTVAQRLSDLHGMFHSCQDFYSDVSRWDVSNATNLGDIFFG